MKGFLKWTKETVVQKRLDNNENGYDWVYKDIKYDKKLAIKEYQDFFDRKDQNKEYKLRYQEDMPSNKKQYAWYQNEINMIYSFHKCFAMRNQTRLQYYRHDLSQKGKRTRYSTNTAIGKFQAFRELAEEKR